MNPTYSFSLGALGPSLLYLALLTSVLSVVLAVWLLLHPPSLLRFHAAASRWISTAAAVEIMERRRQIEHVFYRNHRLCGVFITVGALYSLVGWVAIHQQQGLEKILGPLAGTAGLAIALELSFVALNLLFVPLGLVVLLRPSLVKGFEQWADRWFEMSESARVWDREHYPMDRALTRHPRATGVVILLACAFILSSLNGLALL